MARLSPPAVRKTTAAKREGVIIRIWSAPDEARGHLRTLCAARGKARFRDPVDQKLLRDLFIAPEHLRRREGRRHRVGRDTVISVPHRSAEGRITKIIGRPGDRGSTRS